MQLGCPMTVLYATKDDEYRKPKKGMWDFFLQQYNQGLEPGALHRPQRLLSLFAHATLLLPCTCFSTGLASKVH